MPATLNFPPVITVPPGTGWQTLPLGCGGFATGMFIANDGSMVCQTDVGNIYRWTGLTTDYADPTKKWVPLLTYGTLGNTAVLQGNNGGWEHVLAPNHSNVHAAIFCEIQTGVAGRNWLWYSTNSATTWSKSDLHFDNYSAASNDIQAGSSWGGQFKSYHYKVVIDPANPNVAYCGMPFNSGNSAGAYTSLNKAGGSTLATWTSVKTTGSTPIPGTATNGNISCGLAIDPTSGTTTIGGQTVTNRIIIPIPNSGIYQSTDGGNTFTEIATGTMGFSNFWVGSGGFTAEGIYYCTVIHPTIGGVWRYRAGVWARITPTSGMFNSVDDFLYAFVVIDPRNTTAAKNYLSVCGPQGFGIGYTSLNANTATAASVAWTGATGGMAVMLKSEEHDIYYINDLFGQGPGGFAAANGACVDANGICWWPGNQSLFYLGVSGTNPTPKGPPTYVSANSPQFNGVTSGLSTSITISSIPGGGYTPIGPGSLTLGQVISANGIPDGTTLVSQTSGTTGSTGVYVVSVAINLKVPTRCMLNAFRTASWSMGRGMEATVSEDTVCPPGGTYPVLAAQDLGCPMQGTFTVYPRTMAVPFEEWTCENVEYAASNPACIVARVTGQYGPSAITDGSCYSMSYGADGTWVHPANFPVYNATITAGISNGAGGAGSILNVTACSGIIRPTAWINANPLGDSGPVVQPYGTGGTTGTGGTGTYMVDTTSLVTPGAALYSVQYVNGGHTVAVDPDHWVTVPSGFGTQKYQPTYTTNATGTATWANCAGLPIASWTLRGWQFGATSKPFAVGYGADLGTVWACLFPDRETGTATLYRSTNSGASFSPIGTFTVGIATGVYCLSVPGFPNELWISGLFVGGPFESWGLIHVTGANTTSPQFNLITTPAGTYGILALTLGAPATLGGYPTIYIRIATDTVVKLYRGTYSGTGVAPTWALFGPTGTQQDLPPSCQMAGIQSIRGDWNVYQRLYVSSNGSGFAYYNPTGVFTQRNWVAEGDSITLNAAGYADSARAAAVPAIDTYNNVAIGGSSLGLPSDAPNPTGYSLFMRAPALDARLVSGGTNILSVFIGANGWNPTFLSDYALYLDARRAAGWHVILCTVLPNASVNVGTPTRAVVNTELRLWAVNGSTVPGKHADRIVDFAANPEMGDDADYSNTTYYSDGLHPNNAGHIVLRRIFQPALDAAQRTDTVGPTITSAATGSSVVGTPFGLALAASESCTWSVSGAGFSIFEAYRLVHASGTIGTFPCTITARDGSGNVTNQSFSLSVVAASGAVTWTPKSAPPIQYIGFASSTVTFSAVPIDNPSASNVIIVTFSGSGGGTPAVSIGGNSMTLVTSGGGSFIWQYTGAVFTTPNIVVTGTAVFHILGIQVGYLSGVNPVAVDTEGRSGFMSPIATTNDLTVPANGMGIAVVKHDGTSPSDQFIWVVGTESFDVTTTGTPEPMRMSTGYLTTTGKPTVTINGLDQGTVSLAAASWGPA
jgi:hypothetical protein